MKTCKGLRIKAIHCLVETAKTGDLESEGSRRDGASPRRPGSTSGSLNFGSGVKDRPVGHACLVSAQPAPAGEDSDGSAHCSVMSGWRSQCRETPPPRALDVRDRARHGEAHRALPVQDHHSLVVCVAVDLACSQEGQHLTTFRCSQTCSGMRVTLFVRFASSFARKPHGSSSAIRCRSWFCVLCAAAVPQQC